MTVWWLFNFIYQFIIYFYSIKIIRVMERSSKNYLSIEYMKGIFTAIFTFVYMFVYTIFYPVDSRSNRNNSHRGSGNYDSGNRPGDGRGYGGGSFRYMGGRGWR